MKLFLIVVILLAILFVVLSFGLAVYAMGIRRQTLDQAWAWQEAHYDLSWYGGLKKTAYTVDAEDGYTLHVLFLENPEETDRYVLISHGYTDNRFGSLKYTRMYMDLGFHVILYDLRGHGENAKTICTYTIRERKDLNVLIADARRRYPDMRVFGIHGESLGAATSAACLSLKPQIDFVTADCGFAEIIPVMQGALRGMHFPAFLVYPASLCAKVLYGYRFGQMRPVESLKENQVPILFIHGEADTFIPPEHSRKMGAATAGYREVHLIPGAGHAASMLRAPELYRTYVRGFLDRIGIDHRG